MATVTRTARANVDQTTSTTHAITGVTIPAGDLGIVRFGYKSDSVTIVSVTDDAGNTWDVAVSGHSSSGDAQTGAIAYLVVPAGGLSGATITITLSATSALYADVASFNCDTGWPDQSIVLDAISVNNTGATTAWTSNSTSTTTQDDELLVGAAYAQSAFSGASGSTPSGSWNEERDVALTNGGYRAVTQWQQVSAAGAYACDGTWNVSEIAVCTIATFRIGSDSVAPPSAASKGLWSSGTTSCTPGYPAGIDAGDWLVLAVESSDSTTAAGTPNTPSGWTKLFEETQGNGALAVTTLTVFVKVADGSESGTLTVDGVLNHISASIFRIANAKSDGGTSDITVGTGNGGSTNPSANGITTPVDSCLVLAIFGDTRDAAATTQFSAWTNANLTGLTEWEDHFTSSGAGGGIGVVYGRKDTAGATGATTATQATAGNWRGLQIAFQPIPTASVVTIACAIAGVGAVAAPVKDDRKVAAVVAGQAAVAAPVKDDRRILVAVAGSGSVATAVTVTGGSSVTIAVAISGGGSVSTVVKVDRKVAAAVAGQAALAAAVKATKQVQAAVSGLASLSPGLTPVKLVASAISGQASVSTPVKRSERVAVTLVGASVVAGEVTSLQRAAATVAGAADLVPMVTVDEVNPVAERFRTLVGSGE